MYKMTKTYRVEGGGYLVSIKIRKEDGRTEMSPETEIIHMSGMCCLNAMTWENNYMLSNLYNVMISFQRETVLLRYQTKLLHNTSSVTRHRKHQ